MQIQGAGADPRIHIVPDARMPPSKRRIRGSIPQAVPWLEEDLRLTRIRVIVAGLPALMGELVRVLAAERPAMEIVAELEAGADVSSAAGRLGADVVLMPSGSVDRRSGEAILLANPRLRLLLMSEDARTAQLHRLLPHRMMIDDVSPSELFDAMLGAGRYAASDWRPT
jgi:hypothetical protein